MADTPAALRRFWFEFDLPLDADCPRGTREGVGVTASDLDDALSLVDQRVFVGRPLPPVTARAEDADVYQLCPWLVLPNMTDPSVRGIWFPAGYEERTDAVASLTASPTT